MTLSEPQANEDPPGLPELAVPAECQGIQDKLTAIQVMSAQVIAELKTDNDPDLRAALHVLGERQSALQEELSICISNSLPHFPALAGVFTGVATVTTTNPHAEGPFIVNIVRLLVLFNETRTLLTITDFPPVSTGPFGTPIGTDDVTVTWTTGGIGNYSSGAIWMPIGLHFAHELTEVGPSDVSMDLATAPPGSALQPEPFGNVTLAGYGTFVGGYLDGYMCTIVIAGKISPSRPVTVPDVTGELPAAALSEVQAAGLVPVLEGPNTNRSLVIRQSPLADDVVQQGDTVTLTLSTGPFQ